MSTFDGLDFDDWVKAAFADTGGFTALVVLVEITERDASPAASTFFHVIGDEVEWKAVRRLFASAPGSWDGAAFFIATSSEGGPMEEPLARIELRRVEQMIDDDRLALNEGAFFDRRGRRLRIDEDEGAA
ncbi:MULTISPECIES: hypothetical protein [Methylopila]|uniref:Uncharacterized protein n=2 Tax=Methylopila TaxID=61653 RepID=A0A9W6JMY8_9HYPH|nr:hypothetical protein [Methylopila turkensis]GLK80596.1 hypothetical protein GCM10008174_23370 [Methylopila turkensis]